MAYSFFSAEELEKLARETGFIKRSSCKITGSIFFDLIVFNSSNLKKQSLNDMSIEILEKYKIHIKKQSLHERFNKNALNFLKLILEKILHQQISEDVKGVACQGFGRILIKDSTAFQIDESLQDTYPGSGGDGSKAAVRIQYEYDLLSGKINDLSINAFNQQDCVNSVNTIDLIKENDLVIRDLAYMNLKPLVKIEQQNAYYLSRVKSTTKIYELINEKYVEIDFKRLTMYMKKNIVKVLEKEVYIGNQMKLKTRLIIHLLPEGEVSKRLRKAKKINTKKGHGSLSKSYKARAHLNLFVTNSDPKDIPTEKVWPLYTLRWQIELVFKIWKSIADIDKIKKVKKDRFEIYLYSKLIFIVLCWKIIWRIAGLVYQIDKKAISIYKSFKTIKNRIEKLRELFIFGTIKGKDFIKDFYEVSRIYNLLERRKESPTSLEILLSCRGN